MNAWAWTLVAYFAVVMLAAVGNSSETSTPVVKVLSVVMNALGVILVLLAVGVL